jgi:hypothetical protein
MTGDRSTLAATHPDLSSQWHTKRNGSLSPFDVEGTSSRVIWWQCSEYPDHVWHARINSRVYNRRGCPVCSARKVTPSTSLKALAPKIAREWHPTRNGALLPEQVKPGSSKRVWWRCAKNASHEWIAIVCNRALRAQPCPLCFSVAARYPHLLLEWHPTRNRPLTPEEVKAGSGLKIWWQCSADARHMWSATVYNRARNHTGCPQCAGRGKSRR